MLPEFAIREWSEHVPWTESEQVEQGLLICRALTTSDINIDNVLACYRKYMGFVVGHIPTYKEFIINMEDKMQDDEFLGDTMQLLWPEEEFNQQERHGTNVSIRLVVKVMKTHFPIYLGNGLCKK